MFGYRSSRRVSNLQWTYDIGKWSVGEIGKEMTVGGKVELADGMTRSRVWECRWVGNKTCWVKFAWSRSEKNCMAFESAGSSTWILNIVGYKRNQQNDARSDCSKRCHKRVQLNFDLASANCKTNLKRNQTSRRIYSARTIGLAKV